jgi:hypothetical protein
MAAMSGEVQASPAIRHKRSITLVCGGIGAFVLILLTFPRATPKPVVDVNTPDVELAAIDAFDRGEYGKAVPLLQEASYALRDSPVRRGALLRMLRKAQTALATSGGAAVSTPSATTQRTPHVVAGTGQLNEMTIKDLGNFTYAGAIPDDVQRLSGSRIRLSGYMMPLTEAARVTQFDLVPNLYSCCFNQPPGVEHVVRVTCDRGAAIAYSPGVVVVEGTLTVGERREDGVVVSLFEVQANKVVPQGK